MKALVVGGSGLVGQALTRALERAGFDVVPTAWRRTRAGLRALDIRDEAAVRACVHQVAPAVIFLAVNNPGGVDACEDHPDEAHAVHVGGTRAVAAAGAAAGSLLVYYSTDYIFDGGAGPYTEEDPPHPRSVYGQVKLQSEQAVQEHTAAHLILRTTAVFGWDRTSRNLAMQVWERLQAGDVLPVASDQWCNPTLADGLAEASVRLVQAGARGIFNVTGKDRMPRAQLAQALARAMGLDANLIRSVPTAELKQRAPRPLQGGLRTDKLIGVLGTEPLDLPEALKRFRRQWRVDTHIPAVPPATSDHAQQVRQQILGQVRQYYEHAHAPRPFVPYKTRIQYAGRVFGAEEMVNLVDSALDFWLTLGPYGELFEQKMKQRFGAKDFVLVNAGSAANLAAVLTLMSKQLDAPLQAGDEVITPAVTFPTTLAPIVHGGMIPVFVDSEIGTYNINPLLIEGALSPKTRAIMVPHTLGNPCDLDVLVDVAQRHHLYLIEDTCDALGATFRGRLVGTFGDLGTLSFYPAHHITLGEGGGVIVNRPGLGRIVRSVRDWGRDCWCAPGESNTCGRRFGWQLGGLPRGYDHKYIYTNLGYNLKPTDLQAAVGVAQADRVDEFVRARRRNFTRLYEGLQDYQDRLLLPTLDPRSDPSWFAFPITVKDGVSRSDLVHWLETANIETRELFGGNILKQPAFMGTAHRVHGTLDNTDRVMRDTFFIGVYPGLTEEMIAFVLNAFREFFQQRAHRAG